MQPGQQLELTIDKPAAGGRMIARHDGRIVLVRGAIPGERAVVCIERIERSLAFGDAERIVDPSADRRQTDADLLCGGCLYAHIEYPRQLNLKSEVIADGFTRLGRISLPDRVAVAASAESAYRMRARLHVRGMRVGFYREGTHDLCDASATRQLNDGAVTAAEHAVRSLVDRGCAVSSIEVTENMTAGERVLHVTPGARAKITVEALKGAAAAAGVTGCTARGADGKLYSAGVPVVCDPLDRVTAGRAGAGTLQRHAESFFQANRFLLPTLAGAVLDAVPDGGEVLDLYAGVGLFSVALAASGRERITAVEGDRSSGEDLRRNAASCGAAVRVVIGSVEDFLRRRKGPAPATILVDPPRTGISREAMQAIVAHRAGRVIYISCDPPTMARDARRLLDGGYGLTSLQAFDLFPNTPHVEAVGVFDRQNR